MLIKMKDICGKEFTFFLMMQGIKKPKAEKHS